MKKIFLLSVTLSLISCSNIVISNKKLNLNEKEIVLTFDDGPNPTFNTTSRLLQVLEKHKVKAYFCLIGQNAKEYPDIVQDIYNHGHIIVNHSYSDQTILFKSLSDIQTGINNTSEIFKNILDENLNVNWYRPPYGMYRNSLKGIICKNRLQLLPLSFYAFDAHVLPNKTKTVNDLIWKYLNKYQKAIIVLHDGRDGYQKLNRSLKNDSNSTYNRSWIPEFTDTLLVQLRQKGYRVVLLKDTVINK